ncbi:MAG: hypothetical protein R3D29_07445 [Nitratireductor sp.]
MSDHFPVLHDDCRRLRLFGLTREREKLSRNMNLIGYPVAAKTGKLPGWAGMGKDIPFGAFNQCANGAIRPITSHVRQ